METEKLNTPLNTEKIERSKNLPSIKGKTYNSKSEYLTDLKRIVYSLQLFDTTLATKKLDVHAIVKLITANFDLTIKQSIVNSVEINTVYYRVPTSYVYKELRIEDIEELMTIFGETLQVKYDVLNAPKAVYKILRTNANSNWNIKEYNPAENHYLYLNNGIFNLQNKEFYKTNSKKFTEIVTNYQFFNQLDFDFLKQPVDESKLNLFKTFTKSLANNDKELEQLIHQLIYAVIDGNGRRKYILLSGQAGSGKSTLANILTIIAGNKHTVRFNLTNFGDSDYINNLSMNTKLVIGDDLKKNAKLVGDALSNYKTLVSGNQLSVKVKYEPNRIIECHGVWLQLMNDDPTFYEGGDAMIDRTLLIKIRGKNHRNTTDKMELEIAKRLDHYTGLLSGSCDKGFFNEIISYILQTVEPFDLYIEPKGTRELTEAMVNEGSWAHQFMEDADDKGLFEFNTLILNDLVSMVIAFIKETNIGMTIPSARTITKELTPLLEKKGFFKANNKVKHVPLKDYNAKIVKSKMYNIYPKKLQRIVVYYNSDPKVHSESIKQFKQDMMENKIDFDLSIHQMIILEYLVSKGDMDAIKFKNLLLDKNDDSL